MLTTRVVSASRATTEGWHERVGFCFFRVAPVSEGSGSTRGFCWPGDAREWSCGSSAASGEDGTRGLVPPPPQERQHEGVVLAARRLRGSTRGFGFLFWGRTLLLFVLRVVAGACVGRGTGQPRMPPRERQQEGDWGISSGSTRGLVFFVLADAVAVCFEGCCGSMCWPQERPATHAAAGAAARGIRGIGG